MFCLSGNGYLQEKGIFALKPLLPATLVVKHTTNNFTKLGIPLTITLFWRDDRK
jgi:hypothetical protein